MQIELMAFNNLASISCLLLKDTTKTKNVKLFCIGKLLRGYVFNFSRLPF